VRADMSRRPPNRKKMTSPIATLNSSGATVNVSGLLGSSLSPTRSLTKLP
jgi:hypothetical protein